MCILRPLLPFPICAANVSLGLLLLLLLGGCSASRRISFSFTDSEVEQRLRADVEHLASPTLAGRPVGSRYEREAAAYIVAQFRAAGLKARLLPFTIPSDSASRDSLVPSQNIVAFLDRKADSTLVICAHYDHLGMGSGHSKEIRPRGIHPGADDNASGVAILLELARQLAAKKTTDPAWNYLFIAPSGHEIGLFGSQALVEQEILQAYRVKLLLNLDMVGRLDKRSPTVRFSHCRTVPGLLHYASVPLPPEITLRLDEAGETINDFTTFCEAGLPAISLTTGIHADYHRSSDTPDKINYPGMLSVLQLCRSILRH